jgi:hypothetical protein
MHFQISAQQIINLYLLQARTIVFHLTEGRKVRTAQSDPPVNSRGIIVGAHRQRCTDSATENNCLCWSGDQ